MTGGGRRGGAPVLAALLAFVLSAAVRWPSLPLPIEGDAVAYGALARSLARGEGYAIDGAPHDRYPPLDPAVLSLGLRAGFSVTRTVRWVAVILGALVAPLTVLLGARLARGALSPLLLAALAAAHPALVLFAGGLVPGSEALALDLVLGSFLLLSFDARAARAAGLVLAGLAPLARYDALPFALAALAIAVARVEKGAGRTRAAALPAVAVLLPVLLWCVRNAVVSGSPMGRGYAAHALSLSRLPGNALVLAGLVLPAAGLGILWTFVPRGVRELSRGSGERLPVGRAALLAAAAHLVLVAGFAGPTFSGDGALAFSSGSLRFGLAVVPFVLIAACVGLAARPVAVRRSVAALTLVPAAALSVLLVSGSLQRRLPMPPLAAGRLSLLAEAFRRAVAEARESDWVALDLAPRANQGAEVFLADLGSTGHRVGVVKAPDIPPGLFPLPAVLPLVDELPRERRVVLLTDRPVPEGPVYTAGGQGIFHRILYASVGREGIDTVFTIHQVRRTGK